MRFLFIFTPNFTEWPMAICRELSHRFPEAKFKGIATGAYKNFQRIITNKSPKIEVEWIDDLEKTWLAASYDRGTNKYVHRLGPDTMQRILIADRQVGHGFISGGIYPETALKEKCREIHVIRGYLIGMINYFFEELTKQPPDLVVVPGVASSITLGLGEICRSLEIRFIMFKSCRIGSRRILDDSPTGLESSVAELFEAALSDRKLVERNLPAAWNYLKAFRGKPQGPDYSQYNRNKFLKEHTFEGFLKRALRALRGFGGAIVNKPIRSLRAPTKWKLAFHYLQVECKAKILLHKRLFIKAENLPDEPYAYFPLHVDPEASTMVLAPMHTNQLAVIEALAKSLPFGMNLAVKEHLPMLGKRPRGFYERLIQLPGVFLISPFDDGFAMIRRSSFTCVITGTAGLEAMMLKKPVLIIGRAPYMAIGRGFVHCPDFSSLVNAVTQTLHTPPVDDHRLALYIASILEASFEAPKKIFWGSQVTAETVRSHQEILTHICDRLAAMLDIPKTNRSNLKAL